MNLKQEELKYLYWAPKLFGPYSKTKEDIDKLTDEEKQKLFSDFESIRRQKIISAITSQYSPDVEKINFESTRLSRLDDHELSAAYDQAFDNRQFEAVKAEILSELYARRRNEATEIAANYILKKYHILTTRASSDKLKEHYIYFEGIYVPEGKSYIEEICRQLLGPAYTTHLRNGILAKIEAETFRSLDDIVQEQDDHPELLPVANGILNLGTRELHPFSPKKVFFNKIKAAYDPEATCPKIIEFIKQITAHEDDVTVIQEIFGFILYKEYFLEKAIMFYGSNGRNGKSKLLQLLTELVGKENISGISLQALEKSDFAMKNLFGKMANISGDLSNEAMNNTGNFKAVTGRDVIEANRKNKEYITFVNYAKLIFATNEMPMIYTQTDAFWLRWVVVEFPYQFLPEKEIESLPPGDRGLARIQDPDIIKHIMSQEELNGLLNWALDGLDRLQKNKDFSGTQTAREIKAYWLRRSSSVRAFCQDYVVEDYDGQVTKKEFQRWYSKYCRLYRVKTQSAKAIKEVLMRDYGASEARTVLDNGERSYVWEGIALPNINDLILYSDHGTQPFMIVDKSSTGNEGVLRGAFSGVRASATQDVHSDYGNSYRLGIYNSLAVSKTIDNIGNPSHEENKDIKKMLLENKKEQELIENHSQLTDNEIDNLLEEFIGEEYDER